MSPTINQTQSEPTLPFKEPAPPPAKDPEPTPPNAAPPDPKAVLAQHRALARQVVDLPWQVEASLLEVLFGSNALAREAFRHQLDVQRAELGLAEATPLEKVLIQRVVLTWLQVHQADLEVAGMLQNKGGATHAISCAQKRQQQAHQRWLSSIKTLATVRKLLRPTPSPVEVATRLAGKTEVPERIQARMETACVAN
jgi:hypothetical protein